MKKEKIVIEESDVEVIDVSTFLEEAFVPAPPPEKPAKRYWNGNEVFACDFCAFDSLEEGVLARHREMHVPVEPVVERRIVLTDRFGNLQE